MLKKTLIFVALILSFGLLSTTVYAASDVPLFVDEQIIFDAKSGIAEVNRRMEIAHQMAEIARRLGLSEDGETIQLAKQYWVEANSLKQVLRATIIEHSNPRELSYNVFEKTNITVAGFEKLLAGTNLEGQGQAFYDMEQTYNVNGLFALAVARTESGLGNSKLAKNKNNYFGMLGCSYDSPYEGIMAFGKLMDKQIYYGKTIEAIAKTYCPPTHTKWASQNRDFMQQFWEKLILS